jgi:hypothetical protein
MSASHNLPPDCNLVYQDAIVSDKLVRLLEEVVVTSDPDERGNYPDPCQQFSEFEPGINGQPERLAIGVEDENERLIAYAAATIQEDGRHATVDSFVVRKLDRQRGIAKAMADVGLKLLSASGVATVSFQPFGEIDKVVPHLVTQKGFVYDHDDQEFTSKLDAPHWLDEFLFDADLPLEPSSPDKAREDADLKEPIDPEQVNEFIDTLERLTQSCLAVIKAREPSLKIDAISTYFGFEKAGLDFSVILNASESDYSGWSITEDGDTLIPTAAGQVISKEREYSVLQYQDKRDAAVASFGQELEILGPDGKMRPYLDKTQEASASAQAVFSKGHFQYIMPTLRRLTPEHLVRFESFKPIG